MKEILKALAERPMTPPVLARSIGIDREVLGDMVAGLIAQELVEDAGNKLVITDLGRRSLGLAESAHALPEAGSLMELGDDLPESDISDAVPTAIEAALENLSNVLAPRQIQNLSTKLAVLERLSALLDPTIATVLADIQNDLQKAA